MDVYLKASSMLQMANFIWASARTEGLKTPAFVNQKSKAEFQQFANKFFSSDPNAIGDLKFILGNNSRWDQNLCRYFVVNMLNYFIEEAEDITLLKSNFRFPPMRSLNETQEVVLSAYKPEQVSENYSYTGAVLQLNPRNISIRTRIIYPNLSQAKRTGNPNLAMPKWFTLRYKTSKRKASLGAVSLQPLPPFTIENFTYYDTVAKRTKSDSRVTPQKDELAKIGRLAKFSYCNLADQLKTLLRKAVNLIKDTGYTSDPLYSKDCFDLINLCIPLGNYRFFLTKDLQSRADALRINPSPAETITLFSKDYDYLGSYDIEELRDWIQNFDGDFPDTFFVVTPSNLSHLGEGLLSVKEDLDILDQDSFLKSF